MRKIPLFCITVLSAAFPVSSQNTVHHYVGRINSMQGYHPRLAIISGFECEVLVQQNGDMAQSCQIQVSCRGDLLYHTTSGSCSFGSIRTGLVFRRTTTTITSEDANPSTEDGTPRLSLDLPRGNVVVSEPPAFTPSGLRLNDGYTFVIGGFRQR